jgi:putative cell wall-binding protein
MSRMAGSSRYSTAAAISRNSFPGTANIVFLASGETFPDALAGGPAAARRNAPILLVHHDRLPEETAAELSRLAPRRIFVLGGTGAVSDKVMEAASAYALKVTRLRGSNRYATAAAISQRMWAAAGTVYLASGTDYPDALAGGALAARNGAPILLTHQDRLAQVVADELVRLSPSRVVLLGGASAVGRVVRREVLAILDDVAVSRLSGSDRFATSAAIASAGWSGSSFVYLAAGTNFPDALAGVPAAAMAGAPLLLTRETCLPPAVADMADLLGADNRVLLGGTGVVADGAALTRCE